jgi:hypothetical protein
VSPHVHSRKKEFGVDFVALAYHLFGTLVGLYRGGADYHVAKMMWYECDFRTYMVFADLLLVRILRIVITWL